MNCTNQSSASGGATSFACCGDFGGDPVEFAAALEFRHVHAIAELCLVLLLREHGNQQAAAVGDHQAELGVVQSAIQVRVVGGAAVQLLRGERCAGRLSQRVQHPQHKAAARHGDLLE